MLLDEFELSDEDREKLKLLNCPVPDNEARRIAVLQQTGLLDSSPKEQSFDSFTHLTALMFNMPISLITLVDIDRVWFKSRLGVEWTDVCRSGSFDAYTIIPESSEVYVVPDVTSDPRFEKCDLKYGDLPIRFYAGAAIMVDEMKIGALCILDTEPHPDFSLEDKENLLDICFGVSELAGERRQRALQLNNERANIVVSMMHNLRTPMTTLNFATALLASEAAKLRPSDASDLQASQDEDDGSDDGNTGISGGPSAAARTPYADSNATPRASSIRTVQGPALGGQGEGSPVPAVDRMGSGDTADGGNVTGADVSPGHAGVAPSVDIDSMVQMFSTFDVCYREINTALKQLTLLVDSNLALGQAVVKIGEKGNSSRTRDNASAADLLRSLSAGISEKSGLNGSAMHSGHLSVSPKAATARPMLGARSTSGRAAGALASAGAAGVGSMPGATPGGTSNALYPEMDGSKYAACDLLEYIENLYHTLVSQVSGVRISWEVNTAILGLGKHASYPDAVALLLISALGQLRTQHKHVRIRFHFERFAHEEDLEFSEIASKLIEGIFVIRIQAYTKEDRVAMSGKEGIGASKHISFSAHEKDSFTPAPGASQAEIALAALQHQGSDLGSSAGGFTPSNKTTNTATSAASSTAAHLTAMGGMGAADTAADQTDVYSAQYHLSSVNKVLRTVNGGCLEYPEPIPGDPGRPGLDPEDGFVETPVVMPTQEYWIPCKILPTEEALKSISVKGFLEKASEHTGDTARHATVQHFLEKSASSAQYNSSTSDFDGSPHKLIPEGISASAPSSMKFRPGMSRTGSMRGGMGSEKRGGIGSLADNSDSFNDGEPEIKILKVLIIEDTLPVQKLLSRWMQKARCKVSCAGNGSIGLNQLMTGCFDVVFVDFLMPVMLGITTMKLFQAWVRENAASNDIAAYNSQILVVGMSATALESEQEAAFDYGMHFFCPKPASMDILGLILDAKRNCDTNEAALDRICQATGTDYYTEVIQEYMNADMAEGDETEEADQFPGENGAGGGGVSRAMSLGGVSTEGSLRGGDWADISALSAGGRQDSNGVKDGDSSARSSVKSSTKSSSKGSDKVIKAGFGGSGDADPSVAIGGGGSLNAAHPSAGSVSSQQGSAAGAPGIAITSPLAQQQQHAKAVTDSKSAAMWSVFRSYRQSTRTAVTATVVSYNAADYSVDAVA